MPRRVCVCVSVREDMAHPVRKTPDYCLSVTSAIECSSLSP